MSKLCVDLYRHVYVPILSLRLDLNTVKYSLHIAVQVDVALQLVEKLAFHRILGDEPVLCVMFRDHASPVAFYFSDTKRDVV